MFPITRSNTLAVEKFCFTYLYVYKSAFLYAYDEQDAIRNQGPLVLSSSQGPYSLSLKPSDLQLWAIRRRYDSKSFLTVRIIYPISLMLKDVAVRKVPSFQRLLNNANCLEYLMRHKNFTALFRAHTSQHSSV